MKEFEQILEGCFPELRPVTQAPDREALEALSPFDLDIERKRDYKATDGRSVYAVQNPAFINLQIARRETPVIRRPARRIGDVNRGSVMEFRDSNGEAKAKKSWGA